MPRKSDKRERLIQSAKSLMFRQGFNLTTLADIAQEADVPLGNVYYYFKTKESIGDAVIAHCLLEQNSRLTEYDTLNTPLERLLAFVDYEINEMEWTIKYGNKIGSLCQELAKQGGTLASDCSILLKTSLKWLEKQFAEIGMDHAKAESFSKSFMAKIQGMELMAATFTSSEYMDILCVWIKEDLEIAKQGSESMFSQSENMEAYA